MFTTKAASNFEYGLIGQEKDDCIDLEALISTDHGITADSNAQWHTFNATSQEPTLFHRLLCYPPQGSLKLRPTSWLDGVRGIAALEVYLFHTMGLWITLYPAFHSSPDQNSPLQFPLIRTIFVSGPTAVSLFFAISGYVLTQSSLRSIRDRSPEKVYAAVSSSMFRRGFRLYLPPIALTFCEMVASRFSIGPPLNFTFVPEATPAAQFVDWLAETNRFINPLLQFLSRGPGIDNIHQIRRRDLDSPARVLRLLRLLHPAPLARPGASPFPANVLRCRNLPPFHATRQLALLLLHSRHAPRRLQPAPRVRHLSSPDPKHRMLLDSRTRTFLLHRRPPNLRPQRREPQANARIRDHPIPHTNVAPPRRPRAVCVVDFRDLPLTLHLPAAAHESTLRDELLSVPGQDLLLALPDP